MKSWFKVRWNWFRGQWVSLWLLGPKEEFKLPKTFTRCPICHCKKTVAREAIKPYQVGGKIPQDVFASLDKIGTALMDPTKVALTAPILVRHMDICARCGFYYCTKAEVVNAPIQIQTQPQQNMPRNFKNFR